MFRVHSTRPILPTDPLDLLFLLFPLLCFILRPTSQLVGMLRCTTRTVRATKDGYMKSGWQEMPAEQGDACILKHRCTWRILRTASDNSALAGNRPRVKLMATMYSTTRPLMLVTNDRNTSRVALACWAHNPSKPRFAMAVLLGDFTPLRRSTSEFPHHLQQSPGYNASEPSVALWPPPPNLYTSWCSCSAGMSFSAQQLD